MLSPSHPFQKRPSLSNIWVFFFGSGALHLPLPRSSPLVWNYLQTLWTTGEGALRVYGLWFRVSVGLGVRGSGLRGEASGEKVSPWDVLFCKQIAQLVTLRGCRFRLCEIFWASGLTPTCQGVWHSDGFGSIPRACLKPSAAASQNIRHVGKKLISGPSNLQPGNPQP